MGILFSSLAAPEAPPAVVLVPPLLERERKGRRLLSHEWQPA